jgi:hypothetical protein
MSVAAGSAGPCTCPGLESLRTYGLVLAVLLIALVALPILPAMRDDRSEPRPAQTASVVEDPRANRKGDRRTQSTGLPEARPQQAYHRGRIPRRTGAHPGARTEAAEEGIGARRNRNAACERGRRASTCSPDRRERFPDQNPPFRNLPPGTYRAKGLRSESHRKQSCQRSSAGGRRETQTTRHEAAALDTHPPRHSRQNIRIPRLPALHRQPHGRLDHRTGPRQEIVSLQTCYPAPSFSRSSPKTKRPTSTASTSTIA